MKTPKPYTKELLKEFDRLTMDATSPIQSTRSTGRFALNRFVEKHGKEICDAMFAELQARDAKKGRRNVG